jgi:predicted metal-dependent hydrolase
MPEMSYIQYGNRNINFQIVRSNLRKTVGIYVGPATGVIVRCPQFLRFDEILEIVRKRAQWIIEKHELVKNHSQLNSAKEFVSGESFPYLGRQYRLKVRKTSFEKEERCKLISGRFLVEIDKQLDGKRVKGIVKKALVNWYLERAHEKISQRVKLYARQIWIGTWPERVEIKDYKRQWGSCSHNRVIRLNWKIIVAPVTILDYVVVHELCHLIYSNHSAQFWQKVQTIILDCKNRRDKLREHGLQIGIFD